MAISNNQYDVTQLAKTDNNGFTAALFPQIKDAYVKKMQEIYGYDIDVSSASADGQFVMMESLVLNNIYRTLESIANNMSPAVASGKYLDILASLSGTFRRRETYSTANIYIANSGTNDVTPAKLIFMDKNGNRWQWLNPLDLNGELKVTFPGKTGDNFTPVAITAVCTMLGPVVALGANQAFTTQSDYNTVFNKAPQNRGGDIYSTIDATTLQVFQNENAKVGNTEESDAELRSRRIRSFGQTGHTVEDSLLAGLLGINGVTDAWVYSASDASKTMTDGVTVPIHSTYVVVATQPGITVPDAVIGEVIYNQMTPGIPTVAATGAAGGIAKSYDIPITSVLTNSVRWKQVDYMTPRIEITLTLANGTTALTTDQQNVIKRAAIDYLNNITIDGFVNPQELMLIIAASDFKTLKYGLPTFTVTGVTYMNSGAKTAFTENKALPLSRFNYETATVTTNDSTITIGLGSGNWPA